MNAGRDALGELIAAAGRRSLPPREDYEQVLAAATHAWQRKLRSQRRRRWLYAAVAAALLAGIGVSAIRQWLPEGSASIVASTLVLRGSVAVLAAGDDAWRPLRSDAGITAGARLRTGANGGLAIQLDENTVVRVRAQSELTVEEADALRLHIGTVYVDSGRAEKASSLRIDTELGTVRDIGTIFEVRAAPQTLRIRIREGQIELEAPAQLTRVRSGAGEEIEMSSQGGLRRAAFPPSDAAWAWAAALAVPPETEGRPLLQFLLWVARETGRRLQFQEPAIEADARQVVLHGKTRDLAPLQALDLMLSTTDLEYVLPSDEVIIIRRRAP
jgi:ferric-dicitrate binding protein FerR (iron transport regulator)